MTRKNKHILISAILLSISLIIFDISFAFFNFTAETNEEVLTTGTIYMKLNSSENNVTLTNAFPETQEKADLKTNNYIDFTVKGKNTYEEAIYYEIRVIDGLVPSLYTESNRIDPDNIMLELTNLSTNKIIKVKKYSELIDNRILVKAIRTIDTETETKFRLRVWIDENTLISDTDPNMDYCASDECNSTKGIYNEMFASVKVEVYGDFNEKIYNVMSTFPKAITDKNSLIKEVVFINEDQDLIDTSYESATIKADITYTDKVTGSTELQGLSEYGKVLTYLESIDETYYKLYILSDGYTYLSTGNSLFDGFTNLTTIDLSNVRTKYATSMSKMFNNCTTVTAIDVSNFDTSNVTDMSYMFYKCLNITSLALTKFDTSKVTNMASMFDNCKNMKSFDLSSFNTSNVLNISNMFNNCVNITSLDISNFNTNKVTDMSYLFYNCPSLKTLNHNLNTSLVTNMEYMFYECTSLNNLNLSNFVTTNVTNMRYMFYKCTSLVNLDFSNFNTSKVTDMSYMFYSSTNIKNLDLSYFNTSKVTNMEYMFYNLASLLTLDISNFVTSIVTNMSNMFNSCSNLTTLDLSSFNTNLVTDMSYMFNKCSNLTTIEATSTGFITTNVTLDTDMFLDCSNLVGGNGTRYSSINVDKTYAIIDTSSTPGYFTEKISS